jgi:hypothetical protein
MADYRAYIVGEDGHFLDCKARTCRDDRAAIEWAKQLVASRMIELAAASVLLPNSSPSQNRGRLAV